MYGVVDRLLLQPPGHIVAPDDVRRVFNSRQSFITGETVVLAGLTYPDYADLIERTKHIKLQPHVP